MSDRKFKFRGFDNPSIEGAKVFYGECNLTVGNVYAATCIDEACTKINGPDARFTDDDGENCWEDLCFFDEVFD